MVNIVTAYKNDDTLKPILSKIKKISHNIKSIINTINNKKSEVRIINFLEGEGVVALVNGVEQILKDVFTDV